MEKETLKMEDVLDLMSQYKKDVQAQDSLELEFLTNTSSKEMVQQLKHIVYRTMQMLMILNQNYKDLDIPTKLLLEPTQDLFAGVIHALKWIAIHNNESYNEVFGDSILLQQIGDIIFGTSISKQNPSKSIFERSSGDSIFEGDMLEETDE